MDMNDVDDDNDNNDYYDDEFWLKDWPTDGRTDGRTCSLFVATWNAFARLTFINSEEVFRQDGVTIQFIMNFVFETSFSVFSQ